jgi:hypothetical protein
MADRIGLRRSWFQGRSTFAHYDLTASKRRLALDAGARPIDLGEIPDDILMLREPGTYERRCDRDARIARILDPVENAKAAARIWRERREGERR